MSDSIKERIRKLLAKANNTACTVEEAKAFNAKAYELIEKHNIDRADLEDKETVRTHLTLQVLKRPWSSQILHGLCHLYFCKWYFTRGGRVDNITLVGEENNVAVCHAVAVMVLRAVQQEARTTGGGRSFMTGAAITIYSRCLEMRPKASIAAPTTSATGNALMVLDNSEQAANDQYIKELVGGELAKAKKSVARINSAGAFGAGQRFGNTVPLRGNLLK